jgi:polyisoprenoid-binding protein YceI
MITRHERREPGDTTTDRSPPLPTGTWTIDPADSIVSVVWRAFRLWTMTGRRHGLGVIHLDELPAVGVIRFQQPSGLPVLTMTADPASVETRAVDLDAMRCGPNVSDVMGSRWWTLRSESLEILPPGTWRVMTTFTANGISSPVELRLEVDPQASSPDLLVLRGHGQLDRRGFGTGSRLSTASPQIRLDLTVRARRVGTHTRRGAHRTHPCDDAPVGVKHWRSACAGPAVAVWLRDKLGS